MFDYSFVVRLKEEETDHEVGYPVPLLRFLIENPTHERNRDKTCRHSKRSALSLESQFRLVNDH